VSKKISTSTLKKETKSKKSNAVSDGSSFMQPEPEKKPDKKRSRSKEKKKEHKKDKKEQKSQA
jgi:hypothetical protein